MALDPDLTREFFAVARERHSVHLRRRARQPYPWTSDPILSEWSFTNVFRELDRTTIWFRENVRDRLRGDPSVLLATVVFRLFNRIATGEAVFRQPALGLDEELPGETAWECLARLRDSRGADAVRAAVLHYCSPGPYVTGAYMTKTPTGLDKVNGTVQILTWFLEQRWPLHAPEAGVPYEATWQEAAEACLGGHVDIEHFCLWLRQYPYFGGFSAYEVACDLRHTALLERAPDVLTWANPGPGAHRGLSRLHGRFYRMKQRGSMAGAAPRQQLVEEMRELLELSRRPEYWPSRDSAGRLRTSGYSLGAAERGGDWPAWEMREVEQWCCEMDKYWRVKTGLGEPRKRYRPS